MLGFLERSRQSAHRFCRDNLSTYIDGQLVARDAERVRQHLECCQECRWDLQTLQGTVALLRSLPRVRAPRSFQLPYSVPAPSLPFWMRPWVYNGLRTATAVVAVLLIVSLVGHGLSLPAYGMRMPAAAATPAPAGALAAAPTAVPPGLADSYALQAQPTAAAAAAAPAIATPPPAPATVAPPAPTATTQHDAGPALAAAPTVGTLARGGGGQPEATFESPEAATRAAQAPRGLGAGPDPRTAAAATPVFRAGAAEAAKGTPPPATPVAEPTEEATPTPEPTQEATPEHLALKVGPTTPRGGPREVEPQARENGLTALTGAAPAAGPGWLYRLRQRAAPYPWHWGALVAGGLLAVLAAGTLWLRRARVRWP